MRFGIATALTFAFGGLALLSTGILLFFSFGNTLDATRSVLSTRLESLISEAEQESLNFFQPVERQAAWLAEEIVSGRISPGNSLRFSQTLKGALSAFPQATAVSYQFPDGNGVFYDAKSREMNTVTWPGEWQVPLNRSGANPQTRPPSEGVWVLRPSVLDGTPQSTFIYPVRTPNGDIGVIGIRINVASLSDRLAEDAKLGGYELVRFILFDGNTVVAHPELRGMEELGRPMVGALKDPFIRQLDTAERIELSLINNIEGIETFGIEDIAGEDLRVFAIKEDVYRQSGGNILIGVHFSSETANVEIRRLIGVGVTGLLLLLASLIGAYLLGRWAARPIKTLAAAANLVQANQLDEVPELPDSPVKELSSALGAFNAMVLGLKERERIRDLFGKYVPQNVANLLVADDKVAEPTNAEATVLFLDLVGFSTISEALTPAQLVETMNSFFSAAVEEIEKEQGIVTQFQGDAILAVYNVPVQREDHADAALRTAAAILETIKTHTFAGQTLDCRIGVNTGSLVAGAIGAADRLSYTVYGDAVNVASRLEQLNKENGTRILIAEETVKQASGFDFVEVGLLSVRGRAKDVQTFTFL